MEPFIDMILFLTFYLMGMLYVVLDLRGKKINRLDEMRVSEQAEDARLDRVTSAFFKPVPLNGLLIEREVGRNRVRTLYSCNNCGTSLRNATLCGICAAKKPVSY
jgi:hypothetical protein